jgi:hypothetical protein
VYRLTIRIKIKRVILDERSFMSGTKISTMEVSIMMRPTMKNAKNGKEIVLNLI